MRALLVAPQPMYEDRGTPIALRQVLQALAELGHEVDVLTYPLGRSLALPGVSWYRIRNSFGIRHVPVGFSCRKVALDIVLFRALSRRVSGQRYDWIHAVEEAAFPAALVSRQHGVPLLYDMQSSLPEQLSNHLLFRLPGVPALLRRCERWLLRRADVVVSSRGLKSHVTRSAPATPCREWNFPSAAPYVETGESAAIRRELGLAEGEPVVLYSGTFEPYQGLAALIDAAVGVLAVEPRCRFVLVGGDSRSGRGLERLAAERGIGAQVAVVPRQPRERAWAYLDIADVAVSPRCYGDNLPLKILDYLALGKPIVATRILAHTCLLDEECAELVPVGPDGLAMGILRLLRDRARSTELAAAAARRAQSQFGWDSFVDLVGEVTALAISASTRPASSPAASVHA